MIADVDVFETCAAAGEGPSIILAHYEAAFLTVAKIISHVGISKPSAAPWLSPLEFVPFIFYTLCIDILNFVGMC